MTDVNESTECSGTADCRCFHCNEVRQHERLQHPLSMVREDVDGYYCGVCGKDIGDEMCDGKEPVFLEGYLVDVLTRAVEDALEHQVTKNHPDLVNTALSHIKTWRSQQAQRGRLNRE